MAMAKQTEEAPAPETPAVDAAFQPTFLKDVAKMATLAEEAIKRLRTIVHTSDDFTFKKLDLSGLFPQTVDSLDYLERLEGVVSDHLKQTARFGLSEKASFRAGTPIEENTAGYAGTVTEWMNSVYIPRKEEIDARVDALSKDISDYANLRARDAAFALSVHSDDTNRFIAVAGKPNLNLDGLLAGTLAELKTKFYETELPRPEDLAKLYETCFNAEVKQRGWMELEDAQLIEILEREDALELFQKYTLEREIKVPKEKKPKGLLGRIFEIIGTPAEKGNTRIGSVGSQRSSQILILDPAPTKNKTTKNQDQWIAYWSNITDGRRFASIADYYQVFQQLTDALQNGSPAEKASAEQSIASLRKDFQESYLLTSTRVIYQPNGLEARIIHGYGASNPQSTSERVLQVPLYWETPITSVYAASEGLTYLQALFNTEDSGHAIAEKLSVVSGYQQQDIKLWTSPLQSNQWITRSQLSGRAVGLNSAGGGFHLDADGHPVGCHGRSRGVR